MPDELWENFLNVAPQPPARVQGGGRRRCDDRAVPATIIFVATSGCTWRQLPPVFAASWQTVHHRFTYWSMDRVWAKPHRVILDQLGSSGELDWSRCAIDSASVRAVKGGF
ncbi:transposase [Streptomyces sp. SAI-135]|nr:transposase [Streptomyces sp. SAI-090]MDH6573997.1 transposase [Streptomyces sp. SAI-117]MDH6581267.1 transposase [Streptomyces sp. SAI-133]MDH6613273.1 transposase [Streptomyces sp. SAI-135]